MYEVVMQFGMFPIRGLIFSKLDETSYPGNVINVAYRTKLPILCFTTEQTVPDDRVLIVDADLGLSNVHLMLGITPRRTSPTSSSETPPSRR